MGADIIVYYITGKQLGPRSVPHSWCEECDLTVRAVRGARDALRLSLTELTEAKRSAATSAVGP